MFDVFYIGSNSSLKEVLPFAKQIESVEGVSPKTKMFWLVEPNIEIIDYEVFNYRPEMHDTKYEHIWGSPCPLGNPCPFGSAFHSGSSCPFGKFLPFGRALPFWDAPALWEIPALWEAPARWEAPAL